MSGLKFKKAKNCFKISAEFKEHSNTQALKDKGLKMKWSSNR